MLIQLKMEVKTVTDPTNEIQSSDEETRREFLVNAGKFAIYTTPAIMMLMHPSKDALAQSGGGAKVIHQRRRQIRRRRSRHRR